MGDDLPTKECPNCGGTGKADEKVEDPESGSLDFLSFQCEDCDEFFMGQPDNV